MALMKFNVASLNDIDGGRLRVAVEKMITRCVEDSKDRPALDKPRKVTLEMSFTPTCDDSTGEAETVWFAYQVKASIPALARDTLSLGIQKNGTLVFNEHSPDNVDQKTVFDGDDE